MRLLAGVHGVHVVFTNVMPVWYVVVVQSKLTAKQMQKRETLVENIERSIDEVLARSSGQTGERKRSELDDDMGQIDIETGEILNARGSPVSFEGGRTRVQEELTNDDRLALQQMEEDKAEQDELLDNLGDVVGRIGVLAKGIGEVRGCLAREPLRSNGTSLTPRSWCAITGAGHPKRTTR